MRKMTLLALLLLSWEAAQAVTAYKKWVTLPQSDGTTITVRLMGDEYSHYYITEDSTIMRRLDNGDFEALSADEIEKARLNRASRLSNAEETRRERTSSAKSKARHSSSYTGTKRGLVIMMEFTDQKFRDDDAYDDWNDILNGDGYTGTDCPSYTGVKGSVSDYFTDQSDGDFNLQFDIFGPFTSENSYAYYGQNDPHDDDYIDINMCYLVTEAVDAIKDEVDFSDYDWDGDGEVDQVFILYAGEGENVTGNSSDLIWPHESWLQYYSEYYRTGGYEVEDGILINEYACGAEILYNNWLSGLGTFCHEFSHCLGLPDFYTYYGVDTFGEYDIMDEGSYNDYGWCPPNYTAYERAFCGWHTPVELTEATTVSDMEPLADGGKSYLVRNDAEDEDVDEYYLLENRQLTGWDSAIPADGLLITHYDYDETIWYQNTINDDADHPRAYIIPANNNTNTPAGFPYPYVSAIYFGQKVGNDSLTDNSTPAAIVYNKPANSALSLTYTYYMGKPITNITHEDGLVGFDFMGGSTTGIRQISATATDDSSLSRLYGNAVDVYDNSGRLRRHVDDFQGTDALCLPAGIYIIGGVKVIIK